MNVPWVPCVCVLTVHFSSGRGENEDGAHSAQNAWLHPGHSAADRSAVSSAFAMYASRLGLLHFRAAQR